MVPQPTLAGQPVMPQPPQPTAAAPSLLHLGHVLAMWKSVIFDEWSAFSACVCTAMFFPGVTLVTKHVV